MKKTLLGSVVAVPLFAGMLMTSCGGNKTSDGGDHGADSTKTETDSTTLSTNGGEMMYLVPAPSDMLHFLREISGKGNKNTAFLNTKDNAKKYTLNNDKALNFGIYSCDLSYCSTFEIGTEALKYMHVVKQLGDDIGVSSIIRPELVKRIEANIGNADSLEQLSNDLYLSSFETLQEGKQGSTLALVVVGGYIESLHIACSLTKYEAKSPAIERIAEQKYTLDNIVEFTKKYESDASISPVITQLNDLKTLFDQLNEKAIEAPKTAEKGKKVLGGGTIIEINEAQYKAISEKVKSIRNSFAQIN